MIRPGREDTYPQHSTGHICTVCAGIAGVDLDGIHLCTDDALRSMGANPESECDRPVVAGSKPVDRSMSPSARYQAPARRRRAYGHTYH